MTQLILVDVSDPNSGQAKQNRRSVVQARGLSRLLPQQQQDFKRSRAPHLRRAAHRSKPALPGQDRRAINAAMQDTNVNGIRANYYPES